MNKIDMDKIANAWLSFIKNENKFNLVDNSHININTPITDPFGDSISLMISLQDGIYRITDQGYTIWNLNARGINVKSPRTKRNQLIKSIANFEKVKISKKFEIFKLGNKNNVPQMINDVTQAIIKISNIALTSPSNTRGIFADDVKNYLEENKNNLFNYFTGFNLTGKSQLVYNIDYFFILKSGKGKLTKVYDGLSRASVEQLIGIWLDTENFRKENKNNSTFSVIIPTLLSNDQKELASSLAQHKIDVIDFSNKKAVKNAFSKETV